MTALTAAPATERTEPAAHPSGHPRPDVWATRAAALAAHVRSAGRLPTRTSSDERERSLASWLSKQRLRAARGELDDARRARLDEVAPGWDAAPVGRPLDDDRWKRSADELAAHLDEHGTWPTMWGRMTPLGSWLVRQRAMLRDGALPEHRRAYLDKIAPGWSAERHGGKKLDDDAWVRRADEVVVLHDRDGEWPTQCGEHAPLGMWLNRQRGLARAGALPAHRLAYLDKVAPGWQTNTRRTGRPLAAHR